MKVIKKIIKIFLFLTIGSWLGAILMVFGAACYVTIILAPIGKFLMKSAIWVWKKFLY